MPTIRLPNAWEPRDYQRAAWNYLENGGLRAALAWHRRGGKDDIILRWTSVAAFQRVASYWHMLPQANQARKAIWEAVNPHTGIRRIDEAFPLPLRARTREQEMAITFVNGSTWQVVGSDNFNSLVGSPPAGVVFSEYALADPASWAMIRPILAENGGWSVFISTPRGRNHFAKLIEMAEADPNWFAQRLSADKTNVFTEEQLETERRELCAEHGDEIGTAMWRQEYFCSFDAAVIGSYWGSLMEQAHNDGRICSLPYDPTRPVHTVWDLGMRDHTTVWFFQLVGGWINCIDFLANTGQGLGWYVNKLREKPYTYGKHCLPHDVKVQELGTGLTRQETLHGLGLTCEVVPSLDLMDGINAARLIIPRCRWDAEKCRSGVEALKLYRSKWDAEHKVLSQKPIHDWTSHPADAFRYLAISLGSALPAREDPPPAIINAGFQGGGRRAGRPGGW